MFFWTDPYMKELKKERRQNRKFLKEKAPEVRALEKSGKFVNLSKKRRNAYLLATGLVGLSLSLVAIGVTGIFKIAQDGAAKHEILENHGYSMYTYYTKLEHQTDLMLELASGKITQKDYDERLPLAPVADEETFIKSFGTEEEVATYEALTYDVLSTTIYCLSMCFASSIPIAAAYISGKSAPEKFDCGESDEYAVKVIKGEINPEEHSQFELKYNPNVANFMDF